MKLRTIVASMALISPVIQVQAAVSDADFAALQEQLAAIATRLNTLESENAELKAANAETIKEVVFTREQVENMTPENAAISRTGSGLKVASIDGDKSFAIGGRLQWDYANIDINGENVVNDTYIRRGRIYLKGQSDDWAYKTQLNLDNNRGGLFRRGGTVEDFYVTYKGFGSTANITAGKHNAPFSLERLTSSNDMTALERSASTNFFIFDRQVGIQFHGKSGMFTYGVGAYEAEAALFDSGDPIEDLGSQDLAIIGRLTAAPINNDGNVLHFGAGFVHTTEESKRFGLKDVYNIEAAAVLGAFHVQTEYFNGQLATEGSSEVDTYYLQAGWVITGESRPYKDGKFKRIKPTGDYGAWEVLARYNDGDGDYEGLGDREAKSYLVGINWYANNRVRIGANYAMIEEDVTGQDADIFQTRLQYVFD
ncbi:ATPase [Halieaceae bacterium IMCC14734]|uniref:ATPase n=1 Tax=Candidatus Litorirhabdus singularis TaxID=2518993 RepID=A0ABT3TEI2_9GAMM|nr:porin [Candidatus Litorirhabdus singularis]MCX2980723.1 ATPase [Candidatus Litorirhabdus singularis]